MPDTWVKPFRLYRPDHPPAVYQWVTTVDGIWSRGIPQLSPFVQPAHVVFPAWNTFSYWTPLSMGYPRQEHWSGLPFPSPGDVSDSGLNPCLLHWQTDSLLMSHWGSLGGYTVNVCWMKGGLNKQGREKHFCLSIFRRFNHALLALSSESQAWNRSINDWLLSF